MAERHDSQQDHSFSMDRNVLTDGDRSAVSIHLSRSIVPVSACIFLFFIVTHPFL